MKKEKEEMKEEMMEERMEEKMESKMKKSGPPEHPKLKSKKITNDTSYHLHHPQIKGPKGAKLPPK